MEQKKRKNFLTSYSALLFWSAGLLAFMTIARIVFFIAYGSREYLFESITWQAFFMGFRFDLSATAHVLALPFLWHFTCQLLRFIPSAVYARVQCVLFFALTTAVVTLISIDVGYYSYFNDRFNVLLFGFFEDDTLALIKTFWANYPVLWILLTAGAVLYLIAKLSIFLSRQATGQLQSARGPLWVGLLGIFGIALAARGSLGLFPLGVADTSISNRAFMNSLCYNGLHAFYRAAQLRLNQSSRWDLTASQFGVSSAEQAVALAKNIPTSEVIKTDVLHNFKTQLPKNTWAETTRPHVVVIVNESMGGHALIDHQLVDFDLLGRLAKHKSEDFWWDRFLPSMTATIGSLSALMINTPHRPWGAFLTESYSLGTPFRSAPSRVFAAAGYHTEFVYGGAVGWRDVDKFARTQGFAQITGEPEIEQLLGGQISKHPWGIDDRDLLAYITQQLQAAKEPLFILAMTTGNHPPFVLPYLSEQQGIQKLAPSLEQRLIIDPKLALLRMRAYAYANDEIGHFMDQVKDSPSLAPKTIVAVTGDHGFLIENFRTEEMLKKWAVPFYLYVPREGRPNTFHPDTLGSHEDIFPTIFRRALSQQEVFEFGEDLLQENADKLSTAMHFNQFILTKAGAVIVLPDGRDQFFQWSDRFELQPHAPTPELQRAAAQYRGIMSFLDFYAMSERNR